MRARNAVIYNVDYTFFPGPAMNTRFLARHIFALLCAWFLACGLAAAQQVTISRDSSLHAEPNAGAAVVAQLKQGATAEQIGKQGAWVNVKSASGTGWLYSFNVTYPAGPGAASGGSGAASARRSVTSTIGIRGLEAEDLKKATFDANQLNSLDSFATTKQDAESAARGSGLKGSKVEGPDKKAE